MEFIDLECAHEITEDQALWMHNAVFDPDEPGIHMLGSSIEWLLDYWPKLDPDAPRKVLRVPAPGDRIPSPSGERDLVLEPGAERIEAGGKEIRLQEILLDGAVTETDQGRQKVDQAYIHAGFFRDESGVFIEYHVMNYEERYAPGNWDYQFREIRRDEWDATTGELTKRERVSQY